MNRINFDYKFVDPRSIQATAPISPDFDQERMVHSLQQQQQQTYPRANLMPSPPMVYQQQPLPPPPHQYQNANQEKQQLVAQKDIKQRKSTNYEQRQAFGPQLEHRNPSPHSERRLGQIRREYEDSIINRSSHFLNVNQLGRNTPRHPNTYRQNQLYPDAPVEPPRNEDPLLKRFYPGYNSSSGGAAPFH